MRNLLPGYFSKNREHFSGNRQGDTALSRQRRTQEALEKHASIAIQRFGNRTTRGHVGVATDPDLLKSPIQKELPQRLPAEQLDVLADHVPPMPPQNPGRPTPNVAGPKTHQTTFLKELAHSPNFSIGIFEMLNHTPQRDELIGRGRPQSI